MAEPEQQARKEIDKKLKEAGWIIQDMAEINALAGPGVAVREYPLKSGPVDYLLFVEGDPIGVLEAKLLGHTIGGVESQALRYSKGLPDELDPPVRPLPFAYISTGAITTFTNYLDPDPRSREIFQIHRPETLSEFLAADTLDTWVKDLEARGGEVTAADDTKPSSLRARIQTIPKSPVPGLWEKQNKAIRNLEESLRKNRPRALIQMATGSGKTLTTVAEIYRLIKFAGARRVLFLVDRANLAEQAEKEFAGYTTPDDNRKFTELYNLQRLQSNTIGSSSKVVISTVQRMYSMLKGEPELDPELEQESQFEHDDENEEPVSVVYNQAIPPEYFDFIFIDECHRSIYSRWRQVLEYFDAYLIGLTATPAVHTYGFFQQNLVMEYSHDEAVADKVNVDFEVYRIRTEITEGGATIKAGEGIMVGHRSRQTREKRWKKLDENRTYQASDLDRDVVAMDQIRKVLTAFKERALTEMFPNRQEVPKTVIFAKDDSHAEDILGKVREVFDRGNDFAAKITYRTTGIKPQQFIRDFANNYMPRIVVSVDMISTGTDIKPVEIVMFMRTVKSRNLFEQMKGRGVRIIDDASFAAVSPDGKKKTHFYIVDCVGVTESEMSDTQPLERKKSVPFKKLLQHVGSGGFNPDYLSSLVSRLMRLDRKLTKEEQERVKLAGNGATLASVSGAIVRAINPDEQVIRARADHKLTPETEPTAAQLKTAAKKMAREAVAPLLEKDFRKVVEEVKLAHDQLIDEVSIDKITFAGVSPESREKARTMIQDFKTWLKDPANRAEVDALEYFYSQPHKRRLRLKDIKALHAAIEAPPRAWTTERLWAAYQAIEQNRVRGAGADRKLVDIVSLIRFTLEKDEELAPYSGLVEARFDNWLAQQENKGREFTPEQILWLEMIRDYVATSLEIDLDDFELSPLTQAGGLGKAREVFGAELNGLLDELNEVLAV